MRITLHTVGDLLDQGYSLWAFCTNSGCDDMRRGAGRKLELAELPREQTIDELRPRLRCQSCGEAAAEIRIIANVPPPGSAPAIR